MKLGGMAFAAASVCATLAMAVPARAETFDAGRAEFSVVVADRTVPYENFFTSVSPNESLRVALAADAQAGAYTLVAPDGAEQPFIEGAATWTAPDAPGESRELKIVRAEGGEIALNVFVVEPASSMDADGNLNGYRIGAYPTEPLRGLEVYETPEGFIEVTQDNLDMKISPHFTLGQFLCKQQEDQWPKYVLLDEALILKLEALIQDVNAQGVDTDEFFVMSGYRTPWYNRAIGNTTTYSQHVFGGAADIYVDVAPRDGDMDDLDRDGNVTLADAGWLMDVAAELERENPGMVGGLGKYDRNSAHGPFLHVDSRGFEARW